jgi:hypothetical protein
MAKLINIFTGNTYETLTKRDDAMLPVGYGAPRVDMRTRYLSQNFTAETKTADVVRAMRAKLAK